MNSLGKKEQELAALGAAIGANCVGCTEHHIREARSAGLSDAQILEAVRTAEKVRRVAAAKVLGTARTHLEEGKPRPESDNQACGCRETVEPATPQEDDMKSESKVSDPAGAAEEKKGKEDPFPFDLPETMKKMMTQCCPEKAESIGAMMGRFSAHCAGSASETNEDTSRNPTA